MRLTYYPILAEIKDEYIRLHQQGQSRTVATQTIIQHYRNEITKGRKIMDFSSGSVLLIPIQPQGGLRDARAEKALLTAAGTDGILVIMTQRRHTVGLIAVAAGAFVERVARRNTGSFNDCGGVGMACCPPVRRQVGLDPGMI